MNTGDLFWPGPALAEELVLKVQAKLHRWATDEPRRRFDDLFNLVYDPVFLAAAWFRVKRNKGARSAGTDGRTVASIEREDGVVEFLTGLRADLKACRFGPERVRERMIPKPGSRKLRRLGIPTVRDRIVQASLKLVLEPIFEADFHPCSYGFRPMRRAQDAIAEIHYLSGRSYEWVLEGDITACFDEIDHTALMGRVRDRIGDKRVLSLVKAFLKAGILTEDGLDRETITGTPQGGILSPLLANIALSVLDDHFAKKWADLGPDWKRATHRKRGGATYRLVRYADDFVVMVAGTHEHVEALREEVAAVLAPMGLRLSEAKTRVAHIDEGFDFLGFRIQRRRKRGTAKRATYTYPSKKALLSVMAKVRSLTRRSKHRTLADLLHSVNRVLRGWCNYFRHGVSARTFRYLDLFTWRRVWHWLRKRHTGADWKTLRRRFLTGSPGSRPKEGREVLFLAQQVPVTRYRWRGYRIATPWTSMIEESVA